MARATLVDLVINCVETRVVPSVEVLILSKQTLYFFIPKYPIDEVLDRKRRHSFIKVTEDENGRLSHLIEFALGGYC